MGTSRAGHTVLLGFAESFAAIEAAWSLQRAGFRVLAFTRSGARPPLRHARGIRVDPVTAPEHDVGRWQLDVQGLVDRMAPDAFLPMDDFALWLAHRLDLGGCRLAGPTAVGADVALDKEKQIARAAAAGLLVPPTTVVDSLDDVRCEGGPLFVKPADAVRVEGDRMVRPNGRVCATDDELEEVRTGHRGGRLLLQPVLSGCGEGLFGSTGLGDEPPWSAHRRVRMVNPAGSASSACESADVDDELAGKVRVLLHDLGWRGLFMGEFLRDAAGRVWFMELNGRAWGSLALATARGYHYPAWAVQDLLGIARFPAPPVSPAHVRSRHIGREIVHLAFVLRGPQSVGITQWPGRAETVRNLMTVRRTDRVYNWDPAQLDVLAADTWRTVADQVGRLVRRRP